MLLYHDELSSVELLGQPIITLEFEWMAASRELPIRTQYCSTLEYTLTHHVRRWKDPNDQAYFLRNDAEQIVAIILSL